MNSPQKPHFEDIRTMFNQLAPRYDLFNHLTSFGLAGTWRREALKPLREGMRVLDLGCGTGDLALDAVKRVGPMGEVVGLDPSERMLEFARKRYEKSGLNGQHRISFMLEKAEDLPHQKPYDFIISGFVLRNIYENIDPILSKVFESLKSGGSIGFLDITEPPNSLVRVSWQGYMNVVAGVYGRALFGKDYPRTYLTESAKRFPKPAEFMQKLERAGFKNVTKKTFMLGIIVLYQAEKH